MSVGSGGLSSLRGLLMFGGVFLFPARAPTHAAILPQGREAHMVRLQRRSARQGILTRGAESSAASLQHTGVPALTASRHAWYGCRGVYM